MTRDEAVRQLIALCDQDDAFYLLLRVYRKFDKEKYQALMEAISAYRVLLGKNADVNREAIKWLLETIIIFQNAIDSGYVLADPQEIQGAFLAMNENIRQLLTIPKG